MIIILVWVSLLLSVKSRIVFRMFFFFLKKFMLLLQAAMLCLLLLLLIINYFFIIILHLILLQNPLFRSFWPLKIWSPINPSAICFNYLSINMLLWISSLKSRCSLAIRTTPHSSFDKVTVLAVPIFVMLSSPAWHMHNATFITSKYAFMSCDILWLTAVLSHHVEATGSFMDDCSLKDSYSINSHHFYNLLTIIQKTPQKPGLRLCFLFHCIIGGSHLQF